MKIKIGKDKVVYDGQFIKTIERKFRDKKDKLCVWEMIQRKTYGRIVAIAAITPDRKIVLEKNYRIPLKSYVIELPAGLMDKKGESEIETARRELMEEAGYAVDSLIPLLSGPFNTGLTDDELSIYLGTNARKVAEPNTDECEDIEILTVPLDQMVEYLSFLNCIKVDLKIAAVLPYLKKHGLYK